MSCHSYVIPLAFKSTPTLQSVFQESDKVVCPRRLYVGLQFALLRHPSSDCLIKICIRMQIKEVLGVLGLVPLDWVLP